MKKRFRKIYVEITNVCNLNCSFCPKTVREKRSVSLEEFEHIVKEVKDYTDLVYLHVKGEPLLHKNIIDILKICEKYDLMVNLTTNGTLLKDYAALLNDCKSLRQINISIHSVMVNNNSKKSIFKYLNDVIDCVDTLPDKIISYRLWNNESLDDVEENKQIFDILSKRYDILDIEEKAKKNKFIKLKENVFLNQDVKFKWPSIKNEEISEYGKCLGLKEQIAILSNGDVTLCCLDENADVKLGNIFENKLDNIINSDYSKYIIEGFNNNKLVTKLCKTCGFRKRFD